MTQIESCTLGRRHCCDIDFDGPGLVMAVFGDTGRDCHSTAFLRLTEK